MKIRFICTLSVLVEILVLSGCGGAAVAKSDTPQPVTTATMFPSQVESSTPEATQVPVLSPTVSTIVTVPASGTNTPANRYRSA